MVKLLDVPLFSGSLSSGVDAILEIANAGATDNCLVSATGAHGLITAHDDAQFKIVINSFTLNLPDGMPSVWIGRLKGEKSMERCYGPEIFREVMLQSSALPVQHYFCGGKAGVADDLKVACENKFNNKNIVGTFSPPFREMSDDELRDLAGAINSSNADIVWIGLSTPKQEVFAYRLSQFTKVKLLITVGAAFDFHTGRVIQAPTIIQKLGLEWLFRLIMEPRRLFGRYIKIVPLFIYFNFVEYIQYIFKTRKE